MTNDCIFCRIVDRQAPAKIVFEDETVVAFEDLHPQAPVHLLVVQANNRVPPQLDNALLYTLIAFLIFTILLWQFILWRRFQDPR